jgi:hypothetical protein
VVGKMHLSNRSSPFSTDAEKELNIIHIEPITDHNRITMHLLDVVNVFLQKTSQKRMTEVKTAASDAATMIALDSFCAHELKP